MRFESEFVGDRSGFAWWAIVLAVGGVLLYAIYEYVGAFVLGLFIYYATRPIYERLGDRIPSRSLRAGLALALIALPILLLIGYTVLVGVRELSGLAVADLGTYLRPLRPYVGEAALRNPQELLASLLENPQQLRQFGDADTVQQVVGTAGGYLGVFAAGLVQLFIALAVGFYLLRDDFKLAGWVRSSLARDDPALVAFGTAVDRDLKTVYFGNILNAFVVAVVAAVSYNALDAVAPPALSIPAPTLLGLLTGAASLVPVVGMKIVYVPVALYLFGLSLLTDPASLWYPIAFLVVSLAVVDGATELLLRPYISGRNLHVGLVLFAYILGPLIFGWYGLFLGPLVLVVAVHLARIVLPELVHGEPVDPSADGRDPIPDADGGVEDPSTSSRAADGDDATGETVDAVDGGRVEDGGGPTDDETADEGTIEGGDDAVDERS
ncbi:AI-2E family transporter [Halomarina pelagica]|uniref:AI-2E family transporter n=1 Tax=Halomarina pelagica TaxID=2961599 RepID=UPI0020C2AD1A|nr:AI-2E family transporter [Halomarina sp. BND7]